MPTYEYRCKSCGQHLEVVQAFSDDPLTTCEACGGDLRKVFGNVGITFKGSGFYKTDSRNGSAKSSAKAGTNGSSDKGSSDGGSSTSSDSSSSSSTKSDKPATSTPASAAS